MLCVHKTRGGINTQNTMQSEQIFQWVEQTLREVVESYWQSYNQGDSKALASIASVCDVGIKLASAIDKSPPEQSESEGPQKPKNAQLLPLDRLSPQTLSELLEILQQVDIQNRNTIQE